jgi:hypothetical protein
MTAATAERAARPRAWLAAAASAPLLLSVGLAERAEWTAAGGRSPAAPAPAPLPERLSETGLYLPGGTAEIDPRNLPFVPQYPLWTDGATKRRWIRLPEGAAIDASDPDAWQFPAGTRLWKEFSFGRRVETRFMERLADGTYRYATYLWHEDGRDARLLTASRGAQIPLAGGGVHEVPSESDCRACHQGRSTPVLGMGALQLSPDRDPNAPHREPVVEGSLDLPSLVARGLLVNLPERLLREPPRIASDNPRARAALGYLFGNCSGCHNAEGPIAQVGLDFDQRVGAADPPRALRSAVGQRSGFAIPGAGETLRIAPGRPEASAVAYRMGSRWPASQMPPLGTRAVDHEALELLSGWITHDLAETNQAIGERR